MKQVSYKVDQFSYQVAGSTHIIPSVLSSMPKKSLEFTASNEHEIL